MDRRRRPRRNIKPRKSWVQKCKDCLRQFIAFLFSNVGIICLVVGYTLAGAFVFKQIEGRDDAKGKTFRKEFEDFYNSTMENLWSIATSMVALDGNDFKNKTNLELLKFQNKVVTDVKDNDYDGINIYSDRWSIDAAFLYCLTVITTIGYGNVCPRTDYGKVITIVYAIFGMPLFLLYLSNIGDLLAKSFRWLYAKFCLCKICRSRRRRTLNETATTTAISSTNTWRNASEKTWPNTNFNKRHGEITEGEESDDEDTKSSKSSLSSASTKDPQDVVVPISVCLAIMIGFISLGAFLFGSQEALDFMDGSYFCFISLSTIGFGDIVPSINERQNFKLNFIFCSIYLMLGMALIAMCFNLMQQDVVQKIRTCTDIIKRIARCRR